MAAADGQDMHVLTVGYDPLEDTLIRSPPIAFTVSDVRKGKQGDFNFNALAASDKRPVNLQFGESVSSMVPLKLIEYTSKWQGDRKIMGAVDIGEGCFPSVPHPKSKEIADVIRNWLNEAVFDPLSEIMYSLRTNFSLSLMSMTKEEFMLRRADPIHVNSFSGQPEVNMSSYRDHVLFGDTKYRQFKVNPDGSIVIAKPKIPKFKRNASSDDKKGGSGFAEAMGIVGASIDMYAKFKDDTLTWGFRITMTDVLYRKPNEGELPKRTPVLPSVVESVLKDVKFTEVDSFSDDDSDDEGQLTPPGSPHQTPQKRARRAL